MVISAKIILDSISPDDIRLSTLECTYPRFIHAEVMTHRVLSRNAASSRAIPTKKLLDDVLNNTAMPIYWGKNQPGMQAKEEHYETCFLQPWYMLEKRGPYSREDMWLKARDEAVRMATAFMNAGYHKQIVNRILEPFAHITVLVTATQWSNFFALRDHPDAQPEIAELARCMKAAMNNSSPTLLEPGEWHTPYAGDDEWISLNDLDYSRSECDELLRKVSVSRCARLSYKTFDGKISTVEADLALYDKLAGAIPIHASPLEHQATPDEKVLKLFHNGRILTRDWSNPHLSGNFAPGWIQNRKLFPGECQ